MTTRPISPDTTVSSPTHASTESTVLDGRTAQKTSALKVVASQVGADHVTAVIKFLPADKTTKTPPRFEINGKMFKITQISYKRSPEEKYADINVDDLDESELNNLAKACASLYGDIKPTDPKKPLNKVEFILEQKRADEGLFTSENPRFYQRQSKPGPLFLRQMNTYAQGSKKPEEHEFEMSEYEPKSQAKLQTYLDLAASAAHSIPNIRPKPKTAKSVTSTSKESELKEIEAIRKEFNAYLNTSEEARDPAKLKAAIAEFKQKHKPQESQEEYKEIQDIEDIISQISTANRACAVFDMNGKKIEKMPSDGNCFFHAISKGYQFEREQTPAEIRKEVVAEMRRTLDSDPTVKILIDQSIESYVAAAKQDIENQIASLTTLNDPENKIPELKAALLKLDEVKNDANRYTQYLDNMAQDKTFASFAEFYMISKLCDVNIEIVRQIGTSYIKADKDFKAPSEGCPTITLLLVNGNHFDLILPQ